MSIVSSYEERLSPSRNSLISSEAEFGLTVSSSVYGGLFYLIIGAHGFHVFGTILSLIYCWIFYH